MSLETCTVFAIIFTIICMVLLYALVLPKSKDGNLGAFGQFLHDLFHFKKLYIEAVLRFFYVLATVFCVCFGFFLLFGEQEVFWGDSKSTVWYGLAILVFGPICTRLTYELFMMGILLLKNVMEINNRLGKNMNSNNIFAENGKITEKFSEKASNYIGKVQQAQARPQPQAQPQVQPQQQPQVQPQQQPQVQPQPEPQVQPEESQEYKFCPNCGAKFKQDAAFCGKCGTKL